MMTDRVGQHWGHYQLIKLLGRGHWASVYLGKHRHLHSQAALKVLHDPLAAGEVEGFLTEARTLAHFRHPHIVRVLDFGMQEDVPFLVMDYAPGGTLRTLHPKGTLVPLETVASYVKQVAEALQYAHALRLIHRDLKPENLLLGPDQEILLSDFGLAIVAHSARSQPTQRAAGSLAYMAPEQLQGHPTAASDQYALGVLAYEWLCGSRPFEGSVTEVMVQQLRTPPPSLREQVPTLPATVDHVVLKALAKDPSQRFAAVHDFALALEEACLAETSSGQTLLMPSSHFPAASEQTVRHTLPAPLTPLIGREQEVVAISALLLRPGVRLVTLIGTGGIGKTRLAIHVATEVLADFPDGVFFVSLAPLSDPALVLPTIAQALDVKESGARPLPDLLTAFLRDRHLLLCLDNFEHLLPAAPQLTHLLTTCPLLTLLVTSQAVLHLQGEHIFPVPPLAVPDLTQRPATAETLPEYAAVALFLQRIQASKPTFQLTNANARAVAEICIHLEGLPLAIELAAARIPLFPPQALLTRLTQRLQLLTSGTRDAPARQQTLRDTLAWSYHLLDQEEQRLFRRLAVFVGGCTLQAAEAVCEALGDGAGKGVEGVASLIDKSLVYQAEQEGEEEPRFLMLETMREFALEVLSASGELEATRQAHAAYYLALAEQAEDELEGPEQVRWVKQLEREHDNLRAVFRWALEPESDEEAGGDRRELALRLGGALEQFWIWQLQMNEGRTFLEQAVAASPRVASAPRAKALSAAANLAVVQFDRQQAEVLAEEGLSLSRQLEDQARIPYCLFVLGACAMQRGEYGQARAHFQESATLFRARGNKARLSWVLLVQGTTYYWQGEHIRARVHYEEALALFSDLGNVQGRAMTHFFLGRLLFYGQGDALTARSFLEEASRLFREQGNTLGIAVSLLRSAEAALLGQGDLMTAEIQAEEALGFFKELSYKGGMAEALFVLARVQARQGNYPAARSLYGDLLILAREGDDMGNIHLAFRVENDRDLPWYPSENDDNRNLPFYLEGLAEVVAAQGEGIWAGRLLGTAEAMRQGLHAAQPSVFRTEYERAVVATRAQVGEKLFLAAWAQGRAMTVEQVLTAQGAVTMPTTAPAEPSSVAPPRKASPSPDGLTAREVEVLRLVAQGLTDAQVAEQLVISPRTVNSHVTSIYGKIQVSSRSGATRYAMEHTLI